MLQNAKQWFENYTRQFYSPDPDYNKNIILKTAHCTRVAQIARDIATHEALSPEDQNIAQIIGIVHDIGRFEQYQKYQTFDDHKSINHGKLGAEILEKKFTVDNLTPQHQKWIIDVTRFHNCIQIPKTDDPKLELFLRLIRDADKIDIFRLSCTYFTSRTEKNKNTALELHVSEENTISDNIYECIMKKRLVFKQNIRTLHDFKVLQLSWIFDINYPRSFELLSQNMVIERLHATLPQDNPKVSLIYKKVMGHLEENKPQPNTSTHI